MEGDIRSVCVSSLADLTFDHEEDLSCASCSLLINSSGRGDRQSDAAYPCEASFQSGDQGMGRCKKKQWLRRLRYGEEVTLAVDGRNCADLRLERRFQLSLPAIKIIKTACDSDAD